MRKIGKKKKQTVKPQKLPFPTLRIDCYGKSTYVYLDGMEITSGILELNFKDVGISQDEPPELVLKLQPHAATLRRVGKERIETASSTDRHLSP